MSAILELPEVRARVHPLSVDIYEQLVEQGKMEPGVELIRGVIVEKMTKSSLHFSLTDLFCEHFRGQLPAGYVVRQEGPMRLADSVPEPDVAVVQGTRAKFVRLNPTTADLIVQIAVTSVALDRANASLYAEARVPEYWIVLAQEQQIEVYRQPENGVYQQKRLYAMGETLACESVPGLSAPLEDWFA